MAENNGLVAAQPKGALRMVKPLLSVPEMLRESKEIIQFITDGLEPDIDYGLIPGCGPTPCLKKPGAEKLTKCAQLIVEFEIIEKERLHSEKIEWTRKNGTKGTSVGLYSYVIRCILRHQDGQKVCEGIGSCSTLESKYVDRPRDSENTVLKMAKKRAHVDAVLIAFCLSNRFTQDTDEIKENSDALSGKSPEESGKDNSSSVSSNSANAGGTITLYTGTDEQARGIEAMLKSFKLATETREKVKAAMMNKPYTQQIIKETISQVGAQ